MPLAFAGGGVDECDRRAGSGRRRDLARADAHDALVAWGAGGDPGLQFQRPHRRRSPQVGGGQQEVVLVDQAAAIDVSLLEFLLRQRGGRPDAGTNSVEIGGRHLVRGIDIPGQPEVDGIGGARQRPAEPAGYRVGTMPEPDEQSAARSLGLQCGARHAEIVQLRMSGAAPAVDAEQHAVVSSGAEISRPERDVVRDASGQPVARAIERSESAGPVGGHERPRLELLA